MAPVPVRAAATRARPGARTPARVVRGPVRVFPIWRGRRSRRSVGASSTPGGLTRMTTQVTAPGTGAQPQAETRRYVLEGTLLEACTCDAIIAYHIDRGMIGEVDVSGLTLVGAGHIPGNVLQGNWKILHLIDDRATHEQIVALSEAFTRRLGGPLADRFG